MEWTVQSGLRGSLEYPVAKTTLSNLDSTPALKTSATTSNKFYIKRYFP
jgi:hypothetical protein